jgi:putative hydrolase of the HAD superfamily
MKRRICAVFDIDDTLYLERDYIRSGFEAVGRWAGRWIGVEDFADRCWRRFLAGGRGRIFDEVLRECGKGPATDLISGLVEIYRTHEPSISLAEDASEALRAISSEISIAIISDGPPVSQSRKVEALGLEAFADPIVLTGLRGAEFYKPHREAFQQAALCHSANVYVYIADNPLKDFAAPRELGWTTVRVRRPEGLCCSLENPMTVPDHVMADCSGIPELLAHL